MDGAVAPGEEARGAEALSSEGGEGGPFEVPLGGVHRVHPREEAHLLPAQLLPAAPGLGEGVPRAGQEHVGVVAHEPGGAGVRPEGGRVEARAAGGSDGSEAGELRVGVQRREGAALQERPPEGIEPPPGRGDRAGPGDGEEGQHPAQASSKRPRQRQAFWPPKPKLLERAMRWAAGRVSLGT
ncbi:MAG: hypothetical protein A3I72_04020 [Candidatus Tectomicrobia bacterium RIFCSPLOWO2_02_FULL_70_19]|nr:MAG: hypothetical protein A3I72_04020 [Candidatus Tectomicrobia bacterium RIFCSPLOWO2_02_FULL_70_19]